MRWLPLVAAIIAIIAAGILVNDEMEGVRDKVLTIESSLDSIDRRLQTAETLLKKFGDNALSLDIHINKLIGVIRTEWLDIKNMEDKIAEGKRRARPFLDARNLPAQLPDDKSVESKFLEDELEYMRWMFYKEPFGEGR